MILKFLNSNTSASKFVASDHLNAGTSGRKINKEIPIIKNPKMTTV
ncbi:MAG: hypothetical protein ABI576_08790 [Flavobacterium sp.]